MGSKTYEFLNESFLFNDYEIDHSYSSFSDGEIEKELDNYRTYCLNNIVSLQNEVITAKSNLKVLSSIEKIPYETLKQGALYFDQFVIYDPLYVAGESLHHQSNEYAHHLGYDNKRLDRHQIIKTVVLLKALTPMVAGNYVKLLPLSSLFEPPKMIPVLLPINNYEDGLPKEILDYCHQHVIVNSMQKCEEGNGWYLLDEKSLTPGIMISFDEISDRGYTYHYVSQEVVHLDEATRTVTSKLKLADSPMQQDVWDDWVCQSINRSAQRHVQKIMTENFICHSLGTTYLTDSDFTAQLLTKQLSAIETVETASASQFLNIELPFLDKIDIQKLMTVREYEADTFTSFRVEMERHFRELRSIKDDKELKLKQQNILHELNTQIVGIDKKLSSLKRKGLINAAIMMGGLAATVQTAGWSLLSTALALANGYQSYNEYKSGLNENPCYFLWKVLKK